VCGGDDRHSTVQHIHKVSPTALKNFLVHGNSVNLITALFGAGYVSGVFIKN